MDLEEMKAAWSTMDTELKQQKKLTDQMITDMIHLQSKRKLNTIAIAEGFGIVLSIGMFVYLGLNFAKLNNWLTYSGGIVIAIVLIAGILMGSMIIIRSQKIDLGVNTYVETLNHYANLTKLLRTYKWVTIAFYAVIPLCVIPVGLKLIKNIDVLENAGSFWWAAGVSYLILPFGLWVAFKFYKSNLGSVKQLIEKMAP